MDVPNFAFLQAAQRPQTSKSTPKLEASEHDDKPVTEVRPWNQRMSKESLNKQRSNNKHVPDSSKFVKSELKQGTVNSSTYPLKKTSCERVYPKDNQAKTQESMWREGPFSMLEDYLLLKIRCKGLFGYFLLFNKLTMKPVRESVLYSRMKNLKTMSLESFLRMSAVVEKNPLAAHSLRVTDYVKFNSGESHESFVPSYDIQVDRLSSADINFDSKMTEHDFKTWTSTITNFASCPKHRKSPDCKIRQFAVNYRYCSWKTTKSEEVSVRRTVKMIEEYEDLLSTVSEESIEEQQVKLLADLIELVF